MDTKELRSLLQLSLAASEHVYTEHVSDPQEYISSGKSHLLASVIDSQWIQATLKHSGEDLGRPDAHFTGWGIAFSGDDNRWLYYSTLDCLFRIGWGKDPRNLTDAGWSSDDALAIWLL